MVQAPDRQLQRVQPPVREGRRDDFYVPAAEDVRTQVGKPGAYSFEPVDEALAERTRERLRAVYETAFAAYEELVEAGRRARARPLGAAGRGLHPVLLDRQRAGADELRLAAQLASSRSSRSARYAEAVEVFFAERMPVTHASFVENGRTAALSALRASRRT